MLSVSKVNALPSTLVKDTLYIVADGANNMKLFVADKVGAAARPVSVDVNTSFSKYDLGVATTTGELNLAANQVFTLVNNTNTGKTLSITNAPANRAMTVVVKVAGSSGSVGFPAGAKLADGVDATLGTVSTIFVMLVIGTDVTVTTNLRINS